MLARVIDFDTRAGNEILYSSRNQYFARTCRIHNAGRDMNGNAMDISLGPLDFARMQTNANSDPKWHHSFSDRQSAMDRARWTVKQHEKSISSGLHLATTKAGELPAHSGVMCQ